MKRIKINWFKFTRFIFICLLLVAVLLFIYDFVVYPEMYLTTWKYQLKNEIYSGEQASIDLYEDVYVKNNKDLFNDNFEIRNTYIQKKSNPLKDIETLEYKQIVQEPQLKSLGIFVSTAYCIENYSHICNNGDATKTATGTTPTPGRTIAVDPKVIPYGTKVIINGHTYIAEDTGVAIKGNRIDIVFATHKEALEYGKRYVEVFIYE